MEMLEIVNFDFTANLCHVFLAALCNPLLSKTLSLLFFKYYGGIVSVVEG